MRSPHSPALCSTVSYLRRLVCSNLFVRCVGTSGNRSAGCPPKIFSVHSYVAEVKLVSARSSRFINSLPKSAQAKKARVRFMIHRYFSRCTHNGLLPSSQLNCIYNSVYITLQSRKATSDCHKQGYRFSSSTVPDLCASCSNSHNAYQLQNDKPPYLSAFHRRN